MTSRTSAGKKKIKRLPTDCHSMPVKPQVVKVEFTPHPPRVIELKSEKENPQQANDDAESGEINWRIVGLFSALFPLIGTGILFMLGWAYEVNWYGYFGVSMSQVSTAPQSLIIQSVPAIITFLVSIVLATLTYHFLNMVFSYFGYMIQRARRKEFLNQNFDDPKPSRAFYAREDWLFIYLLTLLFLFIFLWSSYPNLIRSLDIFSPYEIYYLQFLFLFALYGLVALIFLSSAIFLVLWGVASIIFIMQKRLKKMIAKQPFFYKEPQLTF